jgi:hypothetical protein
VREIRKLEIHHSEVLSENCSKILARFSGSLEELTIRLNMNKSDNWDKTAECLSKTPKLKRLTLNSSINYSSKEAEQQNSPDESTEILDLHNLKSLDVTGNYIIHCKSRLQVHYLLARLPPNVLESFSIVLKNCHHSCLETFFGNQKNIKNLTLEKTTWCMGREFKEDMLKDLKLESLTVKCGHGYYAMSSCAVERMVNKQSTLRKLAILDLGNFSVKFIENLTENCPHLEDLKLGIEHLTEEIAKELEKLENLKELSLDVSKTVTKFPLITSNNLTTLKLVIAVGRCFCTPEVFEKLAANVPNRKNFSLKLEMHHDRHDFLIVMLEKLRSSKSLSLYYSRELLPSSELDDRRPNNAVFNESTFLRKLSKMKWSNESLEEFEMFYHFNYNFSVNFCSKLSKECPNVKKACFEFFGKGRKCHTQELGIIVKGWKISLISTGETMMSFQTKL